MPFQNLTSMQHLNTKFQSRRGPIIIFKLQTNRNPASTADQSKEAKGHNQCAILLVNFPDRAFN